MPVILDTPRDPPLPLIPGLQMAIPEEPYRWESYWAPLINDPPERLPTSPQSLVSPLFEYGMIDQGTRQFSARVPPLAEGIGNRVNAGICTPTGATILVLPGPQWFWNDIGQSTIRFSLTGVSRDSAGAALGTCRVMAFSTHDNAFIGETTSDGSGNFTLVVPNNAWRYFLVCYKAGGADVAGTSLNTLVPS